MMQELIKNAISILGEKGQAWIDALPATINILSNQWKLKNITPVNNMSYHYVAKGISNKQPKDWVFVRLILSAAWHIEDNGDPNWDINLTERLF